MSWTVRVIKGRYADSVRMMGTARAIRSMDGVDGCQIGMGTAANLEALAALGAAASATPADIVIAVDGEADAALDAAERALSEATQGGVAGGSDAEPAPRSIASGAARLAGANLALISVPGDYAALAAHQALAHDLDVFLFSDHVSVEHEVELKRRALESGRLMMGPGCGTAMIGGVGLGFANVVRRGTVGIVAAAGTGAQEVACLLDDAGAGVSQIVGVGGRDLSAEVGGAMFRAAMKRLADDDETETLLLVSKPPAPEVVRALAEAVPDGKRVVAAFVGPDPGAAPFELHATLDGGAFAAAGAEPPDCGALERRVDLRHGEGIVLGLYSGGTLAEEATAILDAALGPGGHRVLDLGDEEYTSGRPHPMVDLDLRAGMLAEAARDESVGCVLIDVVLGHGAHADPAGELAPAVARCAERVPVVARVCGTRADPQDAAAQTATLENAGAIVAPSNAGAARLAARSVARVPA